MLVGEPLSAEEAATTRQDEKAHDKGPPLLLASPIPINGGHIGRGFWRRTAKHDLDAIATQPSVFDDPVTRELYDHVVGFHHVFRSGPRPGQYISSEHRQLPEGPRMTTNDFNLGTSLFRLAFLSAELPSQLVSKRVGPDVWIPTQMVLWSVVSCGQYWLSGRASFLATRFLLGFLQGGFIPDIVLYLSYFYTKTELPIRLAWFWIASYLTQIVGAFLAVGILRLRGHGSVAGWRYLFLIEGILTCLCGLLSFALMAPGPTQTKAWFRPKGWFTEREEIIIVNRVLRDDPSKSDMYNRQGLTLKMIWQAMFPVGPPHNYLTLSLRNLGFSTIQSNLLSVPAYVIGAMGLLATCYLSEAINSRVLSTVILQFWALPLLAVAWTSTNSNSVRTRTVSACMYNISVQAGSIIAANIYRVDDGPLYKRGNRVLIGICAANLVLYFLTFLFYRGLNRRREKIWTSMTPTERAEYLESTKDIGNQRLDFRFAY
ncbi:major facilitator superfamily domain-containing protein [Russula brevipes]|nr:major facilitator superfamily domain-containing protein [Russula brevipes]